MTSSVRVEEIDGQQQSFESLSSGELKKYYLSGRTQAKQDDQKGAAEQAEELNLREYQKELCNDACKGYNAIICAPTGSGKTIVAVQVIREHLRSRVRRMQRAKVVMLVPTVHLIDQQSEMISRFLKNEFKVTPIKGGQSSSSKTPKSLMLLKHDVIVMTPQLLVNMLSFDVEESLGDAKNQVSGSSSKNCAIRNGCVNVDLSDITLLIFDECHHADKQHAYNEIMQLYFDRKYDNAANSANNDKQLPQIVGLTASLGVGQADNSGQAVDHVIKICANLDATKLSVVEKYGDELEKHVYSPKDKIISVRSAHADHDLSRNIIKIMGLIEAQLQPIFKRLEESGAKKTKEVSVQPPEKRWSAMYTSWLYGWFHYGPLISDASTKRKFITLLEHLIIYHKSLEINALVPTSFAVKYLEDEYAIKILKQRSDLDKNLVNFYLESLQKRFKLIASTDPPKQIVDNLKRVLIEEHKDKPDSRSLIFVRTRELALAVERFINSDESLKFLNAGHLTGLNSRKELGGQTDAEQKDCVEKFKSGFHKVLVATTVAEEGLDIAKCNLVIKYNHVTNEIALVQRRGRGRAVGSKSILLTHEGWIEQKEMVNLIRERLMKTAIEIIKTKKEEWFVEQIQKRCLQVRQEKEIEKHMRERERQKLGNKTFNVLCKKCDQLLTASTMVRTVQNSYFVSVDPAIWKRLCAEPKPDVMVYSDLSVAGILSCGKCRQDLGVVVKYHQVYLPSLKAENVVLLASDSDNRNKNTAKKWKQIQTKYFVVDPIKSNELPPMFHALQFNVRDRLDKAAEMAERRLEHSEAKKADVVEMGIENADAALRFIEDGVEEKADIDDFVLVDIK